MQFGYYTYASYACLPRLALENPWLRTLAKENESKLDNCSNLNTSEVKLFGFAQLVQWPNTNKVFK